MDQPHTHTHTSAVACVCVCVGRQKKSATRFFLPIAFCVLAQDSRFSLAHREYVLFTHSDGRLSPLHRTTSWTVQFPNFSENQNGFPFYATPKPRRIPTVWPISRWQLIPSRTEKYPAITVLISAHIPQTYRAVEGQFVCPYILLFQNSKLTNLQL